MFGNVNLNSCCVPIFQSLASTVAEINRGSQFFWMLPWPRPPPPSLVLNLLFDKVNPNSCCVPIFQSLASTVAEINRGSVVAASRDI